MRILMVSPYFYPEGGGLERYAYEMAKELSKENEVVVICSTKRESRDEKIGKIKILRKKPNFILSNTPIRFLLPFELLAMMKRKNFELIIAHTPVPFFADVASLVARLLKKPVIIVYHTGELKKGSWVDLLAELYERTIERITLKNTKIISVSRYVQRILWKKGFYSKVKYPKVGEDFLLAEPDFKGKGNVILFVGQLGKFHRWKNLELLLKALVLVKREIPDVKLMVIGSGDLEDYYKRLAKDLNLEKNVEFLGHVGKKELIDAYKKAKILVLPSSKSEAFGMVVLEALALGTPVVVSKVGEFPAIVEEGKSGSLVNLNEKDLAEKILFLLRDEKTRRKMGIIGRKTIKRFIS
ncbi:Glycosyl transferase, group 1 [Thermococcus sp. 2319x1]|uniref:glycosyltransferase family 4 protein n=1 Tax=Thermococcus sp. 2319x1 TaxID=1674923 RepID=UPI00073A60E1|nr:glycosyltransferase family 4 protein [Thermococcus sp. 2319x1]ALV63871.1 Glycosyl transferase, group 1 [Thermococcus sp. 2319x1]